METQHNAQAIKEMMLDIFVGMKGAVTVMCAGVLAWAVYANPIVQSVWSHI